MIEVGQVSDLTPTQLAAPPQTKDVCVTDDTGIRLVMCVLLLNHWGAKLDRQVGDLTSLGAAVIRHEVLRHSPN